ncbi:hypothetical protein HMPREF1868_02053 [Olsenella sp. DNF00959]|nr:hypothetical protein HMPREF1868_02053 [Olsenella sp. DNF00959]
MASSTHDVKRASLSKKYVKRVRSTHVCPVEQARKNALDVVGHFSHAFDVVECSLHALDVVGQLSHALDVFGGETRAFDVVGGHRGQHEAGADQPAADARASIKSSKW